MISIRSREPKALSLDTSSGESIGFCCRLNIFWFSLGSTRLSQYCDYGNLFQCFLFCSHDVPPVFLLDNVPPTSLTSYINSDHVKDKDKTEIRRQTQCLFYWIMCPPPHLTSLTSYINPSGTSDHVNPGKDKDTYRNKKTNTTPILLDNAVAALWIMCPHLTSLTCYINSSGTSNHVNDVKKQLVP